MVLLVALLLPDRPGDLNPGSFAALPVELLLGALILSLVPVGWRRWVAPAMGLGLGLIAVLTVLDLAWYAALARPFDVLSDWGLAGGAWRLASSSLGVPGAVAAILGALLAIVGILTATVWATVRLGSRLAGRRRVALPLVAAASALWLLCAAANLRVVRPYPIAAHPAIDKIGTRVGAIGAELADRRSFRLAAAADPYADVPAERLLTGLRGKRVLLVFVESYGRTALVDPRIADTLDPVLSAGTRDLTAAGMSARSGYLTSPIAGGGSWLAHATLLSGLWVDSQQRFRTVVRTDRLTLTGAFQRAGWRTTAVMPGLNPPWPEGSFYHYDQILGADELGYTGPAFGWTRIPDEYTLNLTYRLLAPDRSGRPAMVVTPLVTSHAPWTPVPPLLGVDDPNGASYPPVTEDAAPPEAIGSREVGRVRADYARSLRYTWRAVLAALERHADDDLVVIVVGDHQPAPVVTGPEAGRDVPISIIARDPAVLDRIADWRWTPGLRPADDAPVWPMNEFRDRFLSAFGPR